MEKALEYPNILINTSEKQNMKREGWFPGNRGNKISFKRQFLPSGSPHSLGCGGNAWSSTAVSFGAGSPQTPTHPWPLWSYTLD